jgi:hypothetical protein
MSDPGKMAVIDEGEGECERERERGGERGMEWLDGRAGKGDADVTGTRARPGDDELRERHVQIAQAQDDDSDATNSAPVCAHLLPLTSTQHHAECTLYPDDLKTHIDGTAMSDGGKSRSSSSCKLPTAQSRTFERTAPHRPAPNRN